MPFSQVPAFDTELTVALLLDDCPERFTIGVKEFRCEYDDGRWRLWSVDCDVSESYGADSYEPPAWIEVLIGEIIGRSIYHHFSPDAVSLDEWACIVEARKRWYEDRIKDLESQVSAYKGQLPDIEDELEQVRLARAAAQPVAAMLLEIFRA